MATAEEQIEELAGLVRIIAREATSTRPWLREDAEQEAMIAAWRRLEEGKSMGIAVHNARQALWEFVRRGRRPTGSTDTNTTDTHRQAVALEKTTSDSEGHTDVIEPADPRAENEYDRIVLREALRVAMEPLPARDREILQTCLYEDLTQRQAAERFGMTHQNISLILKRSMATMRPLLEDAS